MNMLEQFRSARRAGVPLVSITTPDPSALMVAIRGVIEDGASILVWDAARGLDGLNDEGAQFVRDVTAGRFENEVPNLARDLTAVIELPQDGVVFVLNAQDQMSCAAARQAVWNLRDPFKLKSCTCVLISPHLELPASLVYDVISLDDLLPADAELTQALVATYNEQQSEYPEMSDLNAEMVQRVVEAGRGLSSFGFEQVLCMSMNRTGIDIHTMWEHKKAMVRQTPGLQVYDSAFDFESIGGLKGFKQFMNGLFSGSRRPTAIIYIDEIEKAMAGIHGDNTGVSQDFLGVMLTEMQDQRWAGLISVGPPGSGKSLCAQATGNTFGVPTLRLDVGGMKQKELGASEANIRAAMRVIKGMAGRDAFFVATCNSVDVLPTELLRRYKMGLWFFDLPTPEERESIWQICLRRCDLDTHLPRPDDANWTGAEIDTCCDIADRMNASLVDAAAWIRPVAVYRKALIEQMREEADGKWNSASHPGPYRLRRFEDGGSGGRRMKLD